MNKYYVVKPKGLELFSKYEINLYKPIIRLNVENIYLNSETSISTGNVIISYIDTDIILNDKICYDTDSLFEELFNYLIPMNEVLWFEDPNKLESPYKFKILDLDLETKIMNVIAYCRDRKFERPFNYMFLCNVISYYHNDLMVKV